MGWREARKEDRGFTLIEVMITIIVMGIVLAIATASWVGVVRSRNVDSATNQVAAALRLAHSQATNRLADHTFRAPANPVPAGRAPLSTYQVGPTSGPLVTKYLPDGTRIVDATDIKFKADGSAQVMSGTTPIAVQSPADTDTNNTVEINTVTSEIKVVP